MAWLAVSRIVPPSVVMPFASDGARVDHFPDEPVRRLAERITVPSSAWIKRRLSTRASMLRPVHLYAEEAAADDVERHGIAGGQRRCTLPGNDYAFVAHFGRKQGNVLAQQLSLV
jgi:hypothetical protein